MDFFGIFTNKNDLAKFLAIGGIILFVFSLMYPMEKVKEINLLISDTNYKVDLLNAKIVRFGNKLIAVNGGVTIEEKKLLDNEKIELENSQLEVMSLKEKINILDVNLKEYQIYTRIFFWCGIIFGVIGIIAWTISAIIEFKKA